MKNEELRYGGVEVGRRNSEFRDVGGKESSKVLKKIAEN